MTGIQLTQEFYDNVAAEARKDPKHKAEMEEVEKRNEESRMNRLMNQSNEKQIILMSKFSPVPYAKKILDENKFLYDSVKRLWRYNPEEGIWSDDAELFIRSKLRKQLLGEEQQKKQYVDEVIDYIKGLSWREGDITLAPKHLIPFQNVIYDIDKEDFVDFTPEYFITKKIPVKVGVENTEFEMIDVFLEELVGKDKKKVLYELMAYCLYRSYPYQKFFILYGEGQNGKSAYLKLLTKFLGYENISSEKPQSLVANRFAAASLYGKLANISPDIPYTELSDSSVIRELTGEDALTCEQKYRDAFKFYNYAKIIFSANELPQVRDKSYAFDRRVYIILFNKKIQNPDAEIVDKISTPNQLSGLAWYLIKVLKEMKARGFVFENNPSVEEMSGLYNELSNSLFKFLKETTIKEDNSKIADWELKQKFNDYCNQKGLREWRVSEINKTMKEKFVETRMNQTFFNKESGKMESRYVHAWEGFRWK